MLRIVSPNLRPKELIQETRMTFPSDIVTERLRLAAITSDLMRVETATLSQLLDVDVPDIWPPEHWEPHVFGFLEQQYRKAPQTAAWNRYIIFLAEKPAEEPVPKPVLIGTLGGFLRTESEAEVGYSILPPWQRRGLATEGLGVLIQKIFDDAAIHSITAQTFPHLTASIRVLEKSGFRHDGSGDEEGTIRFRLQRSSSPTSPKMPRSC
jgi:RimJ/RimL family protein N-acetyltransferase